MDERSGSTSYNSGRGHLEVEQPLPGVLTSLRIEDRNRNVLASVESEALQYKTFSTYSFNLEPHGMDSNVPLYVVYTAKYVEGEEKVDVLYSVRIERR